MNLISSSDSSERGINTLSNYENPLMKNINFFLPN